jgi:hypothetical protein
MTIPQTYSERGVLSSNDANSIILFKCDECSETSKYLRCFASSPDKKYLCDGCSIKK